MADVFVSYSRQDRARVLPLVGALEGQGWSVWWDPEIAPGQEFDSMIAAELARARAVVVVWTPASVVSRWVRGEAREAADRGVLTPVRFDGAQLPIDARAIHTIDFDGWGESAADPSFQQLSRAISALLRGEPAPEAPVAAARPRKPSGPSICVLPFANISGDVEQEYFSDGISEDIITDLSRISALSVASRNTAFTYKGKAVSVAQVARDLGVTHVLEGSVRKAGNRVRITAQLIDGASDSHVWAERYDRDLDDIFALQDEISRAIADALKLKLLPEEKAALAQKATTNPEAYKLYLMARRYWLSMGATQQRNLIVRLCRRAIELDPEYARAWALLSICMADIRAVGQGYSPEEALSAAERALELDPTLAEAHAAKARVLTGKGLYAQAEAEHRTALELDPDSYEVNAGAARWSMAVGRLTDAVGYFQKAMDLVETDYWAAGMKVEVLEALGDGEGAKAAARAALERIEKVLAAEPDNAGALSFGSGMLASLGETERALEWTEHALLIDPDNANMRYNLSCGLAKAGAHEKALAMLEEILAGTSAEGVRWIQKDHDLDSLRGDPRFQSMVAEAAERLGVV
jgi:TolB-like protein/Tfp pilus assembly protein PilF